MIKTKIYPYTKTKIQKSQVKTRIRIKIKIIIHYSVGTCTVVIEKEKGPLLLLYPNTRLNFADLTIQRVWKNFQNIQPLVDDDKLSVNSTGTPLTKTNRIENLVLCWKFLSKL